ncbi:hypothetical protein GT755_20110 [Herbidospora sp. NEAU-GS84]|uniref:Uncharacterized protein n=1 Tax=Herbidospora solisilvae TaxID=2696284 RepID=A0A7C9JG26_9ACTN|nr:hypothetical protein [Herbidospora solisilvae]NAS23983.1 hypothetical protein [Herbidospora solisilvae]
MTRARVLVALVCVLAALVVAQTLVARAKVAGLRDTIEVYQTKGTVSAATLSGATVREKIVVDLANTRCAGPAGCPPAKRVTVEPCAGGLCVSYDGSRRKKVAVAGGCWRFSFTPTRAAFDPGAGRWFVTEFDARLETKGGGSCGKVKAVWEVTGRPV